MNIFNRNAVTDMEMLACMDVLDDQMKFNAKPKAITPLVTHCKVRIKIQLHCSTHYTCI